MINSNRKQIEQLVKELDILHFKLSQGLEAERHIKAALEIAGLEINRSQLMTEVESNNLRTDLAISTYQAIKLSEIKAVMISSINKNGYFRLTDDFMAILNASLPCGTECPTNMTTLISCQIDIETKHLSFGVLARFPSDRLKILKSDPFVLYNRTGIKNCYRQYSGPEFLLFDTQTKMPCSSP